MAKIVGRPRVEVRATLELNEEELGALDALAGYGTEAFLEVFYKHMGKAYLDRYEHGLRSLFESVRKHVPGMIGQAEKARRSLENR
jgi:hypothetical protein